MVISNYYLSLSGKVKSKFIQDVIELCGISYPSFFYKMRNDSWTKLEREAIERFIQKENEKSSWVLQHAIRLCDVWWRQLYDSAIRIQPGSSGWIAWYHTRVLFRCVPRTWTMLFQVKQKFQIPKIQNSESLHTV